MSNFTVDADGNLYIGVGRDPICDWEEQAYLRSMINESFVFDTEEFIGMCYKQSYDALFYLHWIYYVNQRPIVREIPTRILQNYCCVTVAFPMLDVLGLDSWTKNTCAYLEQLSLLDEPLPLNDPRMNVHNSVDWTNLKI